MEYQENGGPSATIVPGSSAKGAGSPSRRRLALMLGSMFFQVMMAGYDVSNVANIQAALYDDFGKINLLPLVAHGFSGASAATAPISRRLTHIIDSKILMLAMGVLFMVGGIVSATAHSMETIVVGRFIQGISGGPITQLNFAYISHTSGPYTAQVTGLMGMSWSIGLILGPIVGGAFAQNATWRWAFGIVPIIYALTIPFTVLGYPSNIGRDLSKGSVRMELRSFDNIGSILHMASIILLFIAFSYSGTTFAWKSGSSITLFVVWGVTFTAYLVQQATCIRTRPERRILPITLLKQRTAGLVFLCTVCISMAYAGMLYYLPLLYAFTRNLSPIHSAEKVLPFIATVVFGAIFTGTVLPKVQRYAPFYVVGNVLVLLGSVLIAARTTPSTPIGHVIGLSVMAGLGIRMLMQHGQRVLSAALAPSWFSDVSTIRIMGQSLGTSLGLAMMGCLYQNKGYALLREAISSGVSEQDIRETLAGLKSSVSASSDAQQRALIVQAVTKAITLTLYVVVAAAAVGLVGALALKHEKLDFQKGQKENAGAETGAETETSDSGETGEKTNTASV